MPTKRFVWIDRDTAALDLLQLAYHAPQFISEQALYVLSAIRSAVILPDLREITFDFERHYWERINALRAIGSVPGDISFPELASIANQELAERAAIISQRKITPDNLEQLHIPDEMISDIIAFATTHPSNRTWLFDCFARSDPLAVCAVINDRLFYFMPEEMVFTLVHHLVTLLNTHPDLINLFSVHQIYQCNLNDEAVQSFLKRHFDTIVEKAVSIQPEKPSSQELHWAIPFEWPELKMAVFRQRPDYEEKYLKEQAKIADFRHKHMERYKEDLAYQDTAIWREFEALYKLARQNSRSRWQLHRKIYDKQLSIPVRAAAAHFFGKFRDFPYVIDKLSYLVRQPGDTWEDMFSPIRYEAGKALFDTATPQAWEALIAAFFVSPTNMLQTCLLEWIECLTDILSGISTVCQETPGYENLWFKALVEESGD